MKQLDAIESNGGVKAVKRIELPVQVEADQYIKRTNSKISRRNTFFYIE